MAARRYKPPSDARGNYMAFLPFSKRGAGGDGKKEGKRTSKELEKRSERVSAGSADTQGVLA